MRGTGDIIIFFSVIVGLLTAIINVLFAIAVFQDTKDSNRHPNGKTILVEGIIWALATLLGGVFVAGIYWLIHHSTLNPNKFKKD